MANKVQRAEKIFERIAARTGMTEAGKDWLIAVLDPFHDEKLMCCGYPDREVAPSVVQVVKLSTAIVKPAAFTAADNWGFHVRTDDTVYTGVAVGTAGAFVLSTLANTAQYDFTSASATTAVKYGGLTIVYFNQTVNGTTSIVTAPLTEAGNSNRVTQLSISPGNFGAGKTRVISQGFEIVNTTSELYKGGAIAVYEQPGSKQDMFTVYYIATYLNPGGYSQQVYVQDDSEDLPLTYASDDKSIDDSRMFPVCSKVPDISKLADCKLFVRAPKVGFVPIDRAMLPNLAYVSAGTFQRDVLPPVSLAELLILPGSQQWDAKKGCMCVATMNDMGNEPSFPIPIGKWFVVNELTYMLPTGYSSSVTANTTGSFMTFPTSTQYSVSGVYTNVLYENTLTPFNTKGALVSGQLPQATFTVNYNVIVERFISSQDQSLATLAKPSPPEDYVAIQLYSEISQRIPIGVVQSDNGMGDWILGLADEVANLVTTFGKPIMKGVELYQESRAGTPVGATYVAPSAIPRPRPMAGKVKISNRPGKPSPVLQGPRLKSGTFKSPQARTIKKQKKTNKMVAVSNKSSGNV